MYPNPFNPWRRIFSSVAEIAGPTGAAGSKGDGRGLAAADASHDPAEEALDMAARHQENTPCGS
jgi:hypothetical protein